MACLELEGVSKSFGGVRAVDDLSLAAGEGELLTILGPSGSGKSTLLRLIAGLERPDAGAIRIGGRDVTGLPAPERDVSMVFQNFALFPHLSVRRNISFGLEARRVRDAEVDKLVRDVAGWLELDALLERRPAELSGGERQRVALARGLVRKPQVLLMDEPLSNLDAQLRSRARAEVRRVHAESGSTVVYVTHDQSEAMSLGRNVAVVKDGGVEQVARPDDLYNAPATSFVAGFVGNPPMNLVPARRDGQSLAGDDVRFSIKSLRGGTVADGAEVMVGFRPEDVDFNAGGTSFEAVLELTERIGHDHVWHLRAGDFLFAARPPRDARAEVGERFQVGVPEEALRLFDRRTGGAL